MLHLEVDEDDPVDLHEQVAGFGVSQARRGERVA